MIDAPRLHLAPHVLDHHLPPALSKLVRLTPDIFVTSVVKYAIDMARREQRKEFSNLQDLAQATEQ